ncbi:MAG: class I SAM-dependent methyltransferase [Candidatus Aminicenantaceae bacterium]
MKLIRWRMITSQDLLVTEDRTRLADCYVAPALEEAGKVASSICRSAGVEDDRPGILEDLSGVSSARKILAESGARYVVGDLVSLAELEADSTDVCFSMGRLEHFSQESLSVLMGQMSRIIRPGGIASYIVDHRDHFWHFDKSIHCFHHLTYSDKEWASTARGRHMYRNRLLEKDYCRLFEEQGFEVLAAIHRLHREDAAGVDPSSLWGRFSELRQQDLEAAVTHFVVRRP